MDNICYFDILLNDKCLIEGRFSLLPKEIKDYIISLTENKVYDLCLINKYFNDNCKVIRIANNFKYPKLIDNNLEILINLTALKLHKNGIITNEGLKNLRTLT